MLLTDRSIDSPPDIVIDGDEYMASKPLRAFFGDLRVHAKRVARMLAHAQVVTQEANGARHWRDEQLFLGPSLLADLRTRRQLP